MILAQREQLTLAKSEVTVSRLEIERLKLMLAKARREQFGQSSERGRKLLDQLEWQVEEATAGVRIAGKSRKSLDLRIFRRRRAPAGRKIPCSQGTRSG